MPTAPGEGLCASEEPLDIDDVNKNYDKFKKKVEDAQKSATSQDASSELREIRFTGTVIIVCKK